MGNPGKRPSTLASPLGHEDLDPNTATGRVSVILSTTKTVKGLKFRAVSGLRNIMTVLSTTLLL